MNVRPCALLKYSAMKKTRQCNFSRNCGRDCWLPKSWCWAALLHIYSSWVLNCIAWKPGSWTVLLHVQMGAEQHCLVGGWEADCIAGLFEEEVEAVLRGRKGIKGAKYSESNEICWEWSCVFVWNKGHYWKGLSCLWGGNLKKGLFSVFFLKFLFSGNIGVNGAVGWCSWRFRAHHKKCVR